MNMRFCRVASAKYTSAGDTVPLRASTMSSVERIPSMSGHTNSLSRPLSTVGSDSDSKNMPAPGMRTGSRSPRKRGLVIMGTGLLGTGGKAGRA